MFRGPLRFLWTLSTIFTYLQRPFSASVPAEAGRLFAVAAGVHAFISGESLHCFLAGWCANKSYVIATSDFIVQELCESGGGRPGLSVLTSLLVSVDVKIY